MTLLHKRKLNENNEIHLSLWAEELIDGYNNDTFCTTMLKLVNVKKIPSDKYFIDDNKPLYNVVWKDNTLFHVLVVPLTLGNYILHQAHDALGHKGTA